MIEEMNEWVACKRCGGTVFERTMIEDVKIDIARNDSGLITGYTDILESTGDDESKFECKKCGKEWGI